MDLKNLPRFPGEAEDVVLAPPARGKLTYEAFEFASGLAVANGLIGLIFAVNKLDPHEDPALLLLVEATLLFAMLGLLWFGIAGRRILLVAQQKDARTSGVLSLGGVFVGTAGGVLLGWLLLQLVDLIDAEDHRLRHLPHAVAAAVFGGCLLGVLWAGATSMLTGSLEWRLSRVIRTLGALPAFAFRWLFLGHRSPTGLRIRGVRVPARPLLEMLIWLLLVLGAFAWLKWGQLATEPLVTFSRVS